MILVDKDIKEYVEKKELILSGFQEENLNGISYDLTIDVIVDEEGNECPLYSLKAGETVFVKTQERLSIPHDILGRIAEKNSRMRQGLKVDGPHYQPGHVTYAFLRVQNISNKTIELSKGIKIAQIIFEQLTQVPEVPYDAQEKSSFQNEVQYAGLGNYREEYEKQMKAEYEKNKEDLAGISNKIYANVLTIMGVLALATIIASLVII